MTAQDFLCKAVLRRNPADIRGCGDLPLIGKLVQDSSVNYEFGSGVDKITEVYRFHDVADHAEVVAVHDVALFLEEVSMTTGMGLVTESALIPRITSVPS